MSKPQIILIGAGGHARACIDVIELQDEYQIAGLVGMPEEKDAIHLGYSVIASDSDLQRLSKEYQYALVTVGQIRSADNRTHLYQKLTELGFQLPPIISPSAYVSRHASLGRGTIVMHGATINAGANVGHNCIINSRALIEHDATVKDHCHISTGAILNGSVHVGERSFVGSGSTVKEGVRLGSHSIVGMGVSVRHNHADHALLVAGRRT